MAQWPSGQAEGAGTVSAAVGRQAHHPDGLLGEPGVTLTLIDRGDLLAALDRAAARRVTLISAPAGSGKTSLIRGWADRPGQQHRLAVVQVSRDQQDAHLFL